MPHATYQTAVKADIQTLWKILLDKVENPQRYMAHVKACEFIEDRPDFLIREITTDDMVLTERVTVNESLGEVVFTLIDHPLFEGTVKHAIIPPAADLKDGIPVLTTALDWTPKNDQARQIEELAAAQIQDEIKHATDHLKAMAEGAETAKPNAS